ncbi:dihydrolipoyl dehydrogenase [bacterium]|nr:dihydrolipoyl dehydrogenase [bacterium]
MADKREIVIVGGGPAGYVSAIYGAKIGAKPTLVEQASLGGVCTNEGCIPTKTYVTAANNYNIIKEAKKWGIKAEENGFDWDYILSKKNRVVNRISRGIEFLLKKNEVEYIKGKADFVSPTSIDIINGDEKKTIEFEKLLVAIGSRSKSLPIPGAELAGIWDSTDALASTEIPKSLLIIGGGVIGVEMAYVFASFGSKVTIVEILPEILPGFDKEIAEALRKELSKLGVGIRLETTISKIEEKNGCFQVAIGDNSHDFEKVLLAVGRECYDQGALEQIDIGFERGWVKTDNTLQTNHGHIWAAGDVAGGPWLAHKASYDGEIAMENMLGKHMEVDYFSVPGAVFSVLEIGIIGYNKEDAEKNGIDVLEGKFPYIASGRAQAAGEPEGFVKTVVNKANDQVIGLHIIGKDATELLGIASIIVHNKMKIKEVNDTIFAHPTLSEMIRESSLNSIGKSINF